MKKTILTTLICSLIVVGVSLAGVVVYDRFLKTDNEPNYNENDNENNNETYFNSNTLSESNYTSKYFEKTITTYGDVSKYSNIFEYFQDLKLEGIKLEYATNEVKEETVVENIYYRDTYNLTNVEIENFLNEMKTKKAMMVGGFDVSMNAADIEVTYKINGKIHTVSLAAEMWMASTNTDGNIYKIMDNNRPSAVDPYETVFILSNESSDVLENIINRLNSK